ncbi:hypothetical protein SAMN05421636_11246 [Pricia antarctica]|uniref:Uncharacterized protein n=1 Tax=Pricia antarctica TaxID=641691 RepID=A0A1G7IJ88_9FLAO|nr:hypothetical protein SAMN05421636_11246 [Pricia antarctica]
MNYITTLMIGLNIIGTLCFIISKNQRTAKTRIYHLFRKAGLGYIDRQTLRQANALFWIWSVECIQYI